MDLAVRPGDGTVVFRRPSYRVVLDIVGPPLVAVVFLCAACALASESPLAVVGFGFFGLLAAVVSPASARRGRKPALVVSAAGVETPESGFLRWSDVAEVRLERRREMGGPGRHPRRLGIVPTDPSVRPAAGLRVGAFMAEGFMSFTRRLAGEEEMRRDDHAPFGVEEWELSVPLEVAVRAVERHVPVMDAAARDARRATLAVDSGPGSTSLAELRAIDARLAPSAHPGPTPALVALPGPVTRQATFGRRPASAEYRRLVEAIVSLVLMPLSFLAMAAQAGIDPGRLPPGFLVPVAAVAIFVGVRSLVAFVRATHARRGPPAILIVVGPEGIRTPAEGPLAWDEIADIHLGGGWGDDRAELVFVPHDPSLMPSTAGEWSWRASGQGRALRAVVVRADELDGDFDRFVDLVRSYRTVAERRR